MKPVEIAIVGCGAITQKGYLPALPSVPEIRCVSLVDRNAALAQELARRWKIPGAAQELGAVLDRVDAVILAVPNHLHAPMALQALAKRRAVLCEKPLGRTVVEVREMAAAAEASGCALVAGMTLRQYPGLRALQQRMPWDALGAIQHVRARYGAALDWPLASPYLFDREQVGGGVLIDQGVHLLDALLWVLSVERAEVLEAADDGDSRLEADLRARLQLRLPGGPGGVVADIEVSRVRRMANRIDITGAKASLTIPLSSSVLPALNEQGRVRPAVDSGVVPCAGTQCFAGQLQVFARRVREGAAAAGCAEAASQIPVMELVESCYRMRRPLVHAWEAYEPWSAG